MTEHRFELFSVLGLNRCWEWGKQVFHRGGGEVGEGGGVNPGSHIVRDRLHNEKKSLPVHEHGTQ